ncbi:glycine zipper family protein [Anaeromyxobacter oryzae]|uniref:Glycine-zipper-containing OmpA-like membrane domain-containing protein n=1 Tax=Anaeromyxobacter oryzae TaxID=2918170 RepID=A0ABM7X1H7_9BACT|nr:glycine zipper family protein [Anaeromyxobacter oryzae]BDG05605.1 hypothetical protein AMOR_46010 [Anaeromyxobacter oryzae]
MKKRLLVATLALTGAVPSFAQQPAQAPPPPAAQPAAPAQKSLSQQWGLYVYPSKGQTKDVQDKDEYDCYQWAKQQSGIDPLAPATAAPAQPAEAPKGGAVKGAAKGAAAGAAIGAVAGDAGKGAAIGATAGGVKGVAGKKKQQEAAAKEATAATQQQAQQTTATFNKAFGVCLEGRGYSVK